VQVVERHGSHAPATPSTRRRPLQQCAWESPQDSSLFLPAAVTPTRTSKRVQLALRAPEGCAPRAVVVMNTNPLLSGHRAIR
jgi:hypothetical protein